MHPTSPGTGPLPAGFRTPDLLLLFLALLIGGGLLYRVTLGVDLSDEAYYATFIDAWLKSGLMGSTSLVLHQTAALIVLPFALVFHAVTGGEAGLMLFLRAVYLLFAGAAALATLAFISEIRGRRTGLLAALVALSFVPFSLPAPSYNTIGMWGVLAGTMLSGRFLRQEGRTGTGALAALAWAIASIAYPPLVVISPALLLAAFLWLRDAPFRRRSLSLAFLILLLHALGLALVLGLIGPARLMDILRFTTASLGGYASPEGKWTRSLALLAANPTFSASCLAAIALGLWMGLAVHKRGRQAAACLAAMTILVLWRCTAASPALFILAHDIALLLMLFGIFAVAVPLAPTPPETRLVQVLAATGLFGGLVTTASATNGLFNTAIGGLGAAILAAACCLPAAVARGSVPVRRTKYALLLATLLANGTSAFATFYGELPGFLRAPTTRLASGPYAGLRTTEEQARYIEGATNLLARHSVPGGKVTMIGRLAGLYLLTEMAPSTLSSWNFSQHTGALPSLEDITDTFFSDPRHRPDILGVDTDPWTRPPTPAEARLLSGYTLIESMQIGQRVFALYRPAEAPTPRAAP